MSYVTALMASCRTEGQGKCIFGDWCAEGRGDGDVSITVGFGGRDVEGETRLCRRDCEGDSASPSASPSSSSSWSPSSSWSLSSSSPSSSPSPSSWSSPSSLSLSLSSMFSSSSCDSSPDPGTGQLGSSTSDKTAYLLLGRHPRKTPSRLELLKLIATPVTPCIVELVASAG